MVQGAISIAVEYGAQFARLAEQNLHALLAQAFHRMLADGGANQRFRALFLRPAAGGIGACRFLVSQRIAFEFQVLGRGIPKCEKGRLLERSMELGMVVRYGAGNAYFHVMSSES